MLSALPPASSAALHRLLFQWPWFLTQHAMVAALTGCTWAGIFGGTAVWVRLQPWLAREVWGSHMCGLFNGRYHQQLTGPPPRWVRLAQRCCIRWCRCYRRPWERRRCRRPGSVRGVRRRLQAAGGGGRRAGIRARLSKCNPALGVLAGSCRHCNHKPWLQTGPNRA